MVENFKFDYTLDSYEDRYNFIEKNRDIISNNFYRSVASNYLLSSKDVEGADYVNDIRNLHKTTPEYKSYKRLENAWLKSHSMIFSRNSFSPITDNTIKESIPSVTSNYTNEDYNNVLFLFRESNIDSDIIKNILRYGKVIYTCKECSEHLYEQIDFILSRAHEVCEGNKKDLEVLDLFSQDMTMQEISDVMGVSKQAISKRINKIVKKMAL